MKLKKCPICGNDILRFFAHLKMYRYYRCTQCKTVFTVPRISQNKLDRYYKKSFAYSDGAINEHILRARAKKIIQKLISIKSKNASLCDVGSGHGFFLDTAKHHFKIIQGIEPAKKLAHTSGKSFGVLIYTGTVHEYLRSEHCRRFDIVTSIHVIEHLADPQQHLADLFALLKPDGLLYIETPNADSFLFYTEKSKYTFLLAPEHPWIFSQFSFKKLLRRYSCTIQVSTYSYSEHVMGIMKKLLLFSKNKVTNSSAIGAKKSSKSPFTRIPQRNTILKILSYLIFDKCIAKLFTPLLNLNHKGSILELYINKK